MTWRVEHADCVEAMAAMPKESVDAVVTDPPYFLAFMGRTWDTASVGEMQRRHELWAVEALRVLKPGGHLLAFGGTRTHHRLMCAIEDAGFEIRDCICWLYGSGFPKSLDVSKAIDKQAKENDETTRRIAAVATVIREYRERAGLTSREVSTAIVGSPSGACWNWEHQQLPSVAMWPKIKTVLAIPDDFDGLIAGDRSRFVAAERAVTRQIRSGPASVAFVREEAADYAVTIPATPDAVRWQGWGTSLKPAFEPIVVARKPLSGTVAGTVLEHGTGALNIDGCRIGYEEADRAARETRTGSQAGRAYGARNSVPLSGGELAPVNDAGRWPANVCLDPEAAALLDQQTGNRPGSHKQRHDTKTPTSVGGGLGCVLGEETGYGDAGGASRFFYVAKADAEERNAGLAVTSLFSSPNAPSRNDHPTVKPIALMRWLVRLVTPPGGMVLDPFAGSGTTGIAAVLEGFEFVGMEQDEASVKIARARLAHWSNGTGAA